MTIQFDASYDLEPFAPGIDPVKAQLMVGDALARAAQVSPCINEADFPYVDAAKAVIRRAVLRWHSAGSGAAVTETVGPFGRTMDTRQPDRSLFWPAEISELQALCTSWKAQPRAVLPQYVMPPPPRDLFGDGLPR